VEKAFSEIRHKGILGSSQRAELLFISALAALFVAAPAALAITRRVVHLWHQYRAGELPYALLAGLLQPVKERLRRVLEEAPTSQKMAVGDNRRSSKDFVC
jgi:hypothetical protein